MLDPLLVAGLGRAGGKARSVYRLHRIGLSTPPSRVLTYPAAARLAVANPHAERRLRTQIARSFDLPRGVAVRSSADVEDGRTASYAGQFASVLDVTDPDAAVEAVRRVVGSATAPAVTAYAPRTPEVRMGVLVQQMVPPVVSGVAFTVDPATGLHDVVIEAVPGRGDALVQDGMTPDRWVVRGGGTLVTEPGEPVLPASVVLGIAEQARTAARRLGGPLDLEWVFDGHRVVWVQARPVTAYGDVPLYSRRIARDVLPGQVLPLVLTVNSEVVNPAWVDVLRSFVGSVEVDPRRMARTFGYHAYFDMTAFRDVFGTLGLPADSLERLLGLPGLEPGAAMRPGLRALRHLPRAGRQVLRWVRTDSDAVLATLAAAEADTGGDHDIDLLDDATLLERLEHGIARARAVARLSIEVPLVHAAHEAVLWRAVGRTGEGRHVRLARDDERADLDPTTGVRRMAASIAALDPVDRAAVETQGRPALDRPDLAHVTAELEALLGTFGHLAERSNNLSLATWAEDPSIPLRLALAAAEATPDPPALDRSAAVASVPIALRPLVGRLCDRTGELRLLREQVSLGYGRTYMRLRPLALALGASLQKQARLSDADDVFYLTLDELRAVVGGSSDDLAATTRRRRAEAATAAELDLPDVVIGDHYVPRGHAADPGRHVQGAAASAGRHTGSLRVLRSLADSDRLRPGDVLAVETSDVSWTPLFDRAGAVVAESGGLLSHAAVVARERGIPCVVSAAGCVRLPDGSTVEVDGYTGSVQVVK